ncbi:hypothetical protein V7S43_005258 [Phytophthora oleae]|uniref:EF-hand domain-containing protein n=1 Tax=Phytophthora oleae TaxID=2107226 RepID=A0ABD3FW34_9STRA
MCSRLTLVQATRCQLRKYRAQYLMGKGERRFSSQLTTMSVMMTALLRRRSVSSRTWSCSWIQPSRASTSGRQQLEQIFALLDKDDDGSVSGQEIADQLREAGQSGERAHSIAAEMTRLLCDSDDPSEEVTFLPFVGFWIILLADDARVSDPVNEHRVLPALQQLSWAQQHSRFTLPQLGVQCERCRIEVVSLGIPRPFCSAVFLGSRCRRFGAIATTNGGRSADSQAGVMTNCVQQ